MEKKVGLNIPTSEATDNEPTYTMFVNGNPISIPRDQDVEVPEYVKDIYRECEYNEKKANKNSKDKFVVIEM